MKPTMLFLAGLVGASLFVAACDSSDSAVPEPKVATETSLGGGVYRVIDAEAGVVCWVYDRIGPRSGISCIPAHDLSIPANERLFK